MQVRAVVTFLNLSEKSFTDKDGKVIDYYKVAVVDETRNLEELSCTRQVAERIASEFAITDSIEIICNYEKGKLRIIGANRYGS